MKNEKFPKLIYKDQKFEDETREGIQLTHEAIQKLLTIWDDLDLGECSDLVDLITNASKVYQTAYEANVEVPAEIGKYQLNRSAFLDIIEIPVPNSLYVAAKAVQKTPGYGYRDIWSLQDGKLVQDQAMAEEIIHSHNIYAANDLQEELGKACIEYVRLSNYIDQKFTEIPWSYIPAPPWSLVGKHFANLAMLTLEVEQLRVIINKL